MVTVVSVQAHGVCGDEVVFHMHTCVHVCDNVCVSVCMCVCVFLRIDGMAWR